MSIELPGGILLHFGASHAKNIRIAQIINPSGLYSACFIAMEQVGEGSVGPDLLFQSRSLYFLTPPFTLAAVVKTGYVFRNSMPF